VEDSRNRQIASSFLKKAGIVKTLILSMFLVAPFAFAETKWVTAATFGAVKKEDEKALLELAAKGDKEGVLAMIKQGKCLPVAGGTGGLWAGQDAENGLDQLLIPADQRDVKNPGPDSKPLWIPRKFLSETPPSSSEEGSGNQLVPPDSSLSPESRNEAPDAKGDNTRGDASDQDSQLTVSPPPNLSSTDQEPPTAPAPGTWLTDEREATARATREGKNILIDFNGSDWCPWCVKMDHEVLSRLPFKNFAAENLVLLESDWKRKSPSSDTAERQRLQLTQKYQVKGYPTFVLIKPTGEEISRSVGFTAEGSFFQWLQKNASEEEGPITTAPPASDHDFLLSIVRAMASYDWEVLTSHFIDKQINYFGHRHASLDYIINDIQTDAKTFGKQNLTCYWDTFTHERSSEFSSSASERLYYDSVNIYAVIPERGGRTHRAMERLTVGYSDVNDRRTIYSMTLKVLHQ
jgi:thioredoxin-related protein